MMPDAIVGGGYNQQAVLQSRHDWEQTFDALPDLIAIIHVDHTVLRVNRAMAEFCGVPAEELQGRMCHEIFHGLTDVIAGCPHRMMLEDGCGHSCQVEGTGSKAVFDVTVSPIRNSEGAIVSSVHIARNVTARARAEACRNMSREIIIALGESADIKDIMPKLLDLAQAATGVDAVGIRLQEGDDYPYYCQKGFPQEFLQKERSLVQRNLDGGICRDETGSVDLECTCGMVICGRSDPASPNFTSGGSCWNNDTSRTLLRPPEQDLRKNPRNECVHQGYASVALIPIRAKGKIIGLIQLNAIRKDAFCIEEIQALEDFGESIGEALLRKQAEQLLIANERFLRTLTDNLPVMVAYWTADLRCMFANHAHQEWFGMTPEQMKGMPLQEVLGEALFLEDEPLIRGVLKGHPQRFERSLVKPNGETGCCWSHYIPDMADGKAKGFFVVASDVTELKHAEEEKNRLESQLQQAQKLESVGRLAGGVAHDFNNLLTVILGYTQFCLLELKSEHPFHSILCEIRKAAERSVDLTRQLLAFARKQTVTPRVLDLNDTIENMLKMLKRLIGENIKLDWRPSGDLWQVSMDPTQVDQILANLCINARDAISADGSITIATANITFGKEDCAATPALTPGEYVKLVVSDTGAGMDGNTLSHIFEPFFTTKGIGEGTGLGMATVYGIVRQNFGHISVRSEPGQGATFTIYLPRHLGKEQLPPSDSAEVEPPRGRETVLLVDDEISILNITKIFLQRLGYNVLSATTPHEALLLAERRRDEIALVITDVVMPDMNGRELVGRLLEICPRIRCIFMSGYAASTMTRHGVREDGIHFLSKPFSLQELGVKVREVLQTPAP